MVLTCQGCKSHTYQDEKYGKNRRVHNPLKVGKGEVPKFRCTVCENTKSKS